MLVINPHSSPFISQGTQQQYVPLTQNVTHTTQDSLVKPESCWESTLQKIAPSTNSRASAPLSMTEGLENTEQLGLTQLLPIG